MSIEMRGEASAKRALRIWLASELDAPFDPAILTSAEFARYRRLRSPRKRKEFELSRTLLHRLAPPTTPISLSHSAGLVALAIGEPALAIGIDIEVHKSRDVISLARFAFGPEEVEGLAHQPNAVQLFYDLWVLKEACAKALGLPLVDALRTCVFTIENRIIGGVLPTAKPWHAHIWHPRPNLSLGAVVVGSREPVTVHQAEWPSGMPASWPATAAVAGGDATRL
jgi:hypothetical protein